MILQSLCKLYDDLLKRGEISKPGWGKTKVGFALCIDNVGNVTQIIPLSNNSDNKKNQEMILPSKRRHSRDTTPNFLWDNANYFFGIDKTKDKKKIKEDELKVDSKIRFKKSSEFHMEMLGRVNSECAKAIVSFFEKWDPEKCDEVEPLFVNKEALLKKGNIVFRVNGKYAHEDAEISSVWQTFYDQSTGKRIRCLVTGEEDILEEVHPVIKNVYDGPSSLSEKRLVSFEGDSFSSFGKKQGENAPIGKKAAFAYTTALNHLLADRENVQRIGDASVVCWADGAEPQYRDLSLAALFSGSPPEGIGEEELHAIVKRLSDGLPCEERRLFPGTQFYILGISPNAARLSVRFFYRSSFGELMKNVNEHHERLRIVGSRFDFYPLRELLRETVNLNSKDKTPSPVLAGSVTRAVISGGLYPASLLEATMMRIRAERNVTAGRAAILKAYYLRNNNSKCPKEVLQVSLNENSTNIPYTIGRLFAVYEMAQQKANEWDKEPNKPHSTIRDKYFNSVASTPSHILPILNNLYQKHLRKLDKGLQVFFEKQVSELLDVLGDSLPTRLSLPEQGAFQLGYYHQLQKRFEKKEK